MSFFTPLFNAITNKKTLKIKYKSYKSTKAMEEVIYPYYMKEYNQRWFLFALTDKYKSIANFALDRIESIEQNHKKFIPNTTIDFTHYFDDVVGVSVCDGETQKVEILLYKEQAPYTLSKPIHKSQTIIEEREDGSAIISIEVVPNYELTQLLLSFGDRVKILSPASLKEEILAKIKKNIKNYE
jgi:predicted DNA-binding transcriptional regulator YafY